MFLLPVAIAADAAVKIIKEALRNYIIIAQLLSIPLKFIFCTTFANGLKNLEKVLKELNPSKQLSHT